MSLYTFAEWLDQTPASSALKDSALAIPVLQSVHILAIAFVFSGSALLALRSYDLAGTAWSLGQWSGKLAARLWLALGLLLASGSLLVLAEPTRELVNPAFQLKLAVIVPTVAVAVWLARRQAAGEGADLALVVKAGSVVLLLLWAVIIVAGRWIAYI